MGIAVSTGTAEGKTIEQAVDIGGEMLQALLFSMSITAEQIVSMSTQTVHDPVLGRYVYTVALLVRENDAGG